MRKILLVYSFIVVTLQLVMCKLHQFCRSFYEHSYRGSYPDDLELPWLTQFTLKSETWPYVLPLGLLVATILLITRRIPEPALLHVLGIEVALFLFLFMGFGVAYILPFYAQIVPLK